MKGVAAPIRLLEAPPHVADIFLFACGAKKDELWDGPRIRRHTLPTTYTSDVALYGLLFNLFAEPRLAWLVWHCLATFGATLCQIHVFLGVI